MFRVFADIFDLVPRSAVISSAKLMVYRIMHRSVVYLATKKLLDRTGIDFDPTPDQLATRENQRPFGLIEHFEVDPEIDLEPSFNPRWTDYSATVPYQLQWVTLKVTLNADAGVIYWGNHQQPS